MKHLYINNESVDSLADLKSLMEKFGVAKNDNPLFVDMIDNFVDGNIEAFLRTIRTDDLAERIKKIDTTNVDSTVRRKLIEAVCSVKIDPAYKINPLQYLEVVKASVEDNKALLEVKVIKKAVENFNIEIRATQIQLLKSTPVNIKEHHLGEIIALGLDVPERQEEYDIEFAVGERVVGKEIVCKNRSFSINGAVFKMIKVEGDEIETFYIGETQVTQAMWKALRKKNPSYFKGDNRPVERVSWGMCKGFISTLNETLASKIPDGYCFALPSETQWVYAAKGGEKRSGCKFSGCSNKKELEKYAWYEKNATGETHDVKTLEPNELKIFDMSGNVWEWCEDFYSPGSSYRVVRGGSWNVCPERCQLTSRDYFNPDYRDSSGVGFRLALVKKRNKQ